MMLEVDLEKYPPLVQADIASMNHYAKWMIQEAEKRLRAWRIFGFPDGYLIGCPCDACQLARSAMGYAEIPEVER